MNVLDIILAVLFLYAIVKGYRAGLVLELCGIIGVIAAAYISYNFAQEIAVKLLPSLSHNYSLSFFLVFVAVLTAIGIAARIVSRVIDFTGMGFINKICGAVASFLKMAIVLAVFIALFNALNNTVGWVRRDSLKESSGYMSLLRLSQSFFPHIDFKGPSVTEEIRRNIERELGFGDTPATEASDRNGRSAEDIIMEELKRRAARTAADNAAAKPAEPSDKPAEPEKASAQPNEGQEAQESKFSRIIDILLD
ncbi:MAG: CvpA family protein [Rikenellaceae bacterium]|nr:CvpA family protein [Rikenellaceae bacterium]MDE7134385.1 CvpA family protein [Rikenellaceae bacterium]MDE7356683.1 CvpA family protein [Rikenellaceae bacterium]